MKSLKQEGDIRFEWGLAGLAHLLPESEVVIIVDVLSFSTCVDIAVGRDAIVYPFAGDGEDPASFASAREAILAGKPDQKTRFSLSPSSLQGLPAGSRLVLPSPNGSTLSARAGSRLTMTGCLRNARAVAHHARHLGNRISVIAAGERWRDGGLRPALEDLLGAGAILSRLDGTLSVEARAAIAAYRDSRPQLEQRILRSVSGRELVDRGRIEDVHLACELDRSDHAPLLLDGAYRSPLP